MVNYSALHYAAKAEKANTAAQTAAQTAQTAADQAQAIKDSIGAVYKYRGSVDTVSDLPTDAEVGDVYDVIETGSNYAWTGTEWDPLGVTADLSAYLRASGTVVFQDGTFTVKGDNHPFVIEGMAGTTATGLQVKDSLGAGETDLEHYATGDRYGSRLVNRASDGNEGSLDLYTTTDGISVLDATGVSSVLVPTADSGDATSRAASTEFVANALLDKADVDLTNLSTTARTLVANLGMPDYGAGVKIGTNTDYIAPYNGFLIITLQSGGQRNYQVNVNGNVVIRIGTWDNEADYRSITLPIAKDDIVRTDCSAAIFYPCIGG